MRSHDSSVLAQFDPQASAYLTSAVHAAGPDLQRAQQLVNEALPRSATAIDVGCGAGHLGFALAGLVSQVVAADPSPSMLATVTAAARDRGHANIVTQQAGAEALPSGDAGFCLVCSRYSAHHWRDVPAALREMRRVVKPGGYLLMIDLLGEESPLVDTHLQALELLRDPSHVRDYSATQWRALIAAAGFSLREEARWPIRIEFSSWVQRMRTPPDTITAIRAMQRRAPREVWEGLALEEDGSFSPHVGLFWAQAGLGSS